MGVRKEAYINPEMLKWARLRSPFKDNIDELIVKLNIKGISLEKLEMWESGETNPTITQAKDLAEIYNISFAALYLSKIPEIEEPRYVDKRTIDSKISSKISYNLWKKINSFVLYREKALELLDNDLDEYERIPFKNIDNSNDIANIIRDFFVIDTPVTYKKEFNDNPFEYFKDKIEDKGVFVFQIDGIPLEEARGISLSYDILPIIAVNKNDTNSGKVFSLFHELAHLIRRTSVLCNQSENIETSDPEETICNRIAAETIIPKQNFLENNLVRSLNADNFDQNVERMSGIYGVSKFVIIRRLLELNKINKKVYNNKYNLYMDIYYNQVEKNKNKQIIVKYHKRLLGNIGNLYPQIILSAYSNGKISFGEIARILNVKTSHIDEIEKVVMLK